MDFPDEGPASKLERSVLTVLKHFDVDRPCRLDELYHQFPRGTYHLVLRGRPLYEFVDDLYRTGLLTKSSEATDAGYQLTLLGAYERDRLKRKVKHSPDEAISSDYPALGA